MAPGHPTDHRAGASAGHLRRHHALRTRHTGLEQARSHPARSRRAHHVPGRGDGANTALRDAVLLGPALAHAGPDMPSTHDVVRRYETAMRTYGLAAIRASRTAPFTFDPART
ncbi:hypothetical protein GCM10017581_098680 [Dactylosporangium matsuzakiense]|uniref:FAD-binding domain-containing protein n=1 Tax=Dactylosporangium matsuzakiense TaxID=53360 RepID=A0A9W6KUW3_9ACTN|nr:hypothetical protein GCM10017581_098680 [Dactylosporangium matsuzakiense]